MDQDQALHINRETFDHQNEVRVRFQLPPGLNEEVVRAISKQKDEPRWMLDLRLRSLALWNTMPWPTWGPDISKLDINEIRFFLEPDAKHNAKSWEDLPADIKKTFERLGIPEAERTSLGGVGAQYESMVVYHNIKKELEEQGVIFEDLDVAVKKYPELVKEHFMTRCIPIGDHKFIALHGAVWSGGTFIYIPKGVKVELPLQAYFRMNSEKMGQFEHTLIIVDEGAEIQYIEGCSAPQYAQNSLHAGCVEVYVKKGARARYSSVENWSKNTYNLNTKRALVDEDGVMEWIGGNMGSGVTMLYPCSMLIGKNARADHISIAFAGPGQNQDTGAKVYHLAPYTRSIIKAKSISKDGGITTYRGSVKVIKGAKGVKSNVQCDALMVGETSRSDTVPYIEIDESDTEIAHEATVGKVGDEQLFYLQSRGLNEEQAMQMIVNGFIKPITKELPLEYAVELNRLIELEMEGSVG